MFLNDAFKNIKVQSLNIRLSLFTIKLYNLLIDVKISISKNWN